MGNTDSNDNPLCCNNETEDLRNASTIVHTSYRNSFLKSQQGDTNETQSQQQQQVTNNNNENRLSIIFQNSPNLQAQHSPQPEITTIFASCPKCLDRIQIDDLQLSCGHSFHRKCLTSSIMYQCQAGLQLWSCITCKQEYGADIITIHNLTIPSTFYTCSKCKQCIIELTVGQNSIRSCQKCQSFRGWQAIQQ